MAQSQPSVGRGMAGGYRDPPELPPSSVFQSEQSQVGRTKKSGYFCHFRMSRDQLECSLPIDNQLVGAALPIMVTSSLNRECPDISKGLLQTALQGLLFFKWLINTTATSTLLVNIVSLRLLYCFRSSEFCLHLGPMLT